MKVLLFHRTKLMSSSWNLRSQKCQKLGWDFDLGSLWIFFNVFGSFLVLFDFTPWVYPQALYLHSHDRYKGNPELLCSWYIETLIHVYNHQEKLSFSLQFKFRFFREIIWLSSFDRYLPWFNYQQWPYG